jgi:Domain of unknown function (DUF4430)
MRTTQKKKSIYLILGIIAIGLITYIFFLKSNSTTQEFEAQTQDTQTQQDKVSESSEPKVETPKVNTVQRASTSDQVVFPKARISIFGEDLEVAITDKMTVYDAMNVLKEEGKITFEGKNYPGLGFFVTKINSLESGDGKNLMYDINGVEASVGISTYEIKEGDIIEWKLK